VRVAAGNGRNVADDAATRTVGTVSAFALWSDDLEWIALAPTISTLVVNATAPPFANTLTIPALPALAPTSEKRSVSKLRLRPARAAQLARGKGISAAAELRSATRAR
jgi:hypothetical protein